MESGFYLSSQDAIHWKFLQEDRFRDGTYHEEE